ARERRRRLRVHEVRRPLRQARRRVSPGVGAPRKERRPGRRRLPGRAGRALVGTRHASRLVRMFDEATRFLTLILEGDRRSAEAFARRAFERHGVRFLYEEIVQPALEQVGELWFANRISAAEEHIATATAESAVCALYPRFPWPPRGPRALIACAEG